MAAGKLDQTSKQQQPRRQLLKRGSNTLPEADTTPDVPAVVTKATKPPRPTRRQQQQQQAVPQSEAQAEPQRASKRLKTIRSNSSDSSDAAERDATAAGTNSAAVSRRGSPAAASAAAATPAAQHCEAASAPKPGVPAVAVTPGSSGMSAFEAERAARIASNLARLAALQLPELAADLAASVPVKHKAAPSQRGVGAKRKRSEQQQPLRQSARTRGQAPDPTTAGGIDYEGRDGTVVLAAALHHLPQHAAAGAAASNDAAAAAAAAVLTAPVQFKSTNGDEETDAAFLALLKSQASAAAAAAESSLDSSSSAAVTGHELSRLSLSAVDVAKMTRDGVSCLAFHPAADKLLIAAADKQGKVGLWDIDHKQQQPDAGDGSSSSSSYDGVLMFEPHRDYVSSLKWCQGGRRLMTGSYDGTVRLLDVETGVFDVVSGFPPGSSDEGWSAGEAAADGALMFLATSDGHLTCHDTRQPDSSSSWVIGNRKVNTLHLHSNQHHLASSASDGAVAVWDVRQLSAPAAATGATNKPHAAKAVSKMNHQKSSQAAYWCPDGSCRLLSISFDDTLRIWEDPGGKGHMQQKLSIRHNNNTGRWVIPFRPAWSPAGDAVVVGDLKRGVAVFDSSNGKQLALLQAEALTAIPSRMALHPSRQVTVLAAATSSGRVHIWR